MFGQAFCHEHSNDWEDDHCGSVKILSAPPDRLKGITHFWQRLLPVIEMLKDESLDRRAPRTLLTTMAAMGSLDNGLGSLRRANEAPRRIKPNGMQI